MNTTSSKKEWVIAVAFMSIVAPAQLVGQTAQPQAPPQITVTSRGEVQVTPDRARVQVGVETEARTAADAASQNARKQTAVLQAIRALGIPQGAITTLNYSVYPIHRWNESTKRSDLIGYRVSNIVQVDADKIEQAGPIIDAGLKAGANRVAALEFRLSDQARYRDSALTLAVQNARRQADVVARAAGGTVAELLEINVMEMERPERLMMAQMKTADGAAAEATPISEGSMSVSIMISTRWRYARTP